MTDLTKRPSHNEVLEIRGRSNILFVTVCAKQRTALFNNEKFQEVLVDAWSQADNWLVGKYMIMPDHIHFFCAPNMNPPSPLRQWIKYWKRIVSQSLPDAYPKPLWLADCWDRQMRTGDAYTEKWAYIQNNPVRAGLVSHASEWPYQDELHPLIWRTP